MIIIIIIIIIIITSVLFYDTQFKTALIVINGVLYHAA